MDNFEYRNNRLHAEELDLNLIAEQYSTPTYVYSRDTLERNYVAYSEALKGCEHLVCYAVKANSNIAVLNVLARLGAGFDIVSIGELERVLVAGGDPKRIVFSGVGKQVHEMQRALEVGVYCFNVESEAELVRLQSVAASLGCIAPVSLRINPDVDAKTHPYISTGLKENKFGIGIDQAPAAYAQAAAMDNIKVIGVDCHIGSQLTSIEPYLDAMDRLFVLIDTIAAQGIIVEHLDLGGGLGVCYGDEEPPAIADVMTHIRGHLGARKLALVFEPGRSICADAGVLLTRVEYIKNNQDKYFAIVDAAMNDLIRPALYSAWQDIIPVDLNSDAQAQNFDIVGPICESSDFLGKDRKLALEAGDLLAVCSSGAYGFGMASNYNSRNRAAEVMVDGNSSHLIGEREELTQQWARERLLPKD
ncbi:MAG: diaminopimelate decarboxylase [Oceanospirillaceae bacterium]|jgi:diaminopimelate decarboxylase|nr:diaminopimelate decarboxylase [Oceanospirillaceae bacterium]MBT4998423.1 diaminopimelate decarboxylase [Oceanospirillaceae bacterium]MBT5630706.1 diaminopimelate decarboxylase [Oceanospirillaceae bacterium]MBT6102060.1 diaminopimelate decarboxylase [Oceanospirillaceae bacterium]MDB9906150.1 diaminopimelate decarboxylase [Oceanospirillaceae bacterium]